jgi:hypothetical protein
MPDVYVADNKGRQEKNEPNSETTVPDAKQTVSKILEKAGETPGKAAGGAFCVRPGSRFINEQNDEEVVLMLRAHPIVNLGWIVSLVFVVLIIEIFLGTGILEGVPEKYTFMARLVVYLIGFGFAFQKFLNWYYSVLIVTNERIIDVDFVNLLYRVVSYATLNHIEEPSMVAGGFVRSFFRYGDIYIETAAEVPTIEAKSVPYPDRAIKIISELSEELEKRRELGQ